MFSIINAEILMVLMALGSFSDNIKTNIMIIIFGLPYLIYHLLFIFNNKDLKESINKIRIFNKINLLLLLFEIIIYIIMILLYFLNINYIYISIISIIIVFINIAIENNVIYIMSLTIPIDKYIYKINVGNFFDLSIIFFKILAFTFLFFMNKNDFSQLFQKITNYEEKNTELIILLGIACFFSIFKFIVFFFFIYNIKYSSLTRIMNKKTYEN